VLPVHPCQAVGYADASLPWRRGVAPPQAYAARRLAAGKTKRDARRILTRRLALAEQVGALVGLLEVLVEVLVATHRIASPVVVYIHLHSSVQADVPPVLGVRGEQGDSTRSSEEGRNMTMTREAVRTVGWTLAALATVAALSGCASQVTPAQIGREARSQANLSTGATGPAAPSQTGPLARGTPSRLVDRRRGRRGPPLRRGVAL
jgi:hypothetical protein